jgi:hypothetical protein
LAAPATARLAAMISIFGRNILSPFFGWRLAQLDMAARSGK